MSLAQALLTLEGLRDGLALAPGDGTRGIGVVDPCPCDGDILLLSFAPQEAHALMDTSQSGGAAAGEGVEDGGPFRGDEAHKESHQVDAFDRGVVV